MDVLSHRGLWVQENTGMQTVENTLPAFARALDEGADGFECDIHRTLDGELVVHHDAEAKDVGVLANCTLDEIRNRRPEIPTLRETLDLCRGRRCNVEIKNLPTDADFDPSNRVVALLADVLASRAGQDQVIVSSFNLATMDACRARMPSVTLGWLIGPGIDPVMALETVRAHGLDALHPSIFGLAAPVAERLAAAAVDVELNVWTVNDPDDACRLASAGVTSIITDNVPAIRAALA